MSRDDLDKAAGLLGRRVSFRQCLHIAANRRQGRPELVRHIRDEVAADLIDALQLGDVVQHHHDACVAGLADA